MRMLCVVLITTISFGKGKKICEIVLVCTVTSCVPLSASVVRKLVLLENNFS